MRRPQTFAMLLLALALVLSFGVRHTRTAGAAAPQPTPTSTELTSGWALRSANNVTDTGATISRRSFAFRVTVWLNEMLG